MKRASILILTNDVDYLYIPRLETVEALLMSGHRVALCAPSNDWVLFFESLGCILHPLEFTTRCKNPFPNLKVLVDYFALVSLLELDLTLIYGIKSNTYVSLVRWRLNVPYIIENLMQKMVLSTNHIGCRDTFDDGVSGIMFESRSVDALVEAIEKFIHLPYQEKITMGLAGRAKVEREFDRTLIVKAYMKAVQAVITEVKR